MVVSKICHFLPSRVDKLHRVKAHSRRPKCGGHRFDIPMKQKLLDGVLAGCGRYNRFATLAVCESRLMVS